jgi:hypothetical protein
MVVLGCSYERLAESDPGLARAFTLLAVFPADFDIAGAAAVLDVTAAEAEETLVLLASRSLLQEPVPGRWRLHDLLRELALRRLPRGLLNLARHRYRQTYLALLQTCRAESKQKKENYRSVLDNFEQEFSNLLAATNQVTEMGIWDVAAAANGSLGFLLGEIGSLIAAFGSRARWHCPSGVMVLSEVDARWCSPHDGVRWLIVSECRLRGHAAPTVFPRSIGLRPVGTLLSTAARRKLDQAMASFFHWNSVPFFQSVSIRTAILRAVAIAAFLKPRRPASRTAHDLSGEKRRTW